jgi:hypothetical protein
MICQAYIGGDAKSKHYEAKGESALINSKPCPQNPKLRIAGNIEEKIVYLRTASYFLVPTEIS